MVPLSLRSQLLLPAIDRKLYGALSSLLLARESKAVDDKTKPSVSPIKNVTGPDLDKSPMIPHFLRLDELCLSRSLTLFT